MTIDFLTGLLYLAMLGVVIVLGFGLFNLFRTDDKARSRPNKLMRLRVLVQFIAVILIAVIFFLKDRFGG